MSEQMTEDKNLQWHPAFYAGIQIELKDEADKLIFENEHQLGTKPMEIDVLIIKKNSEIPVSKNIGRIFRKHNIIEYKSPRDYLSIDDFYKVYGYACFYKADTGQTDFVKVTELTISFFCNKYPGKLIQHLRKMRNYKVECIEKGIYRVTGDAIPMQIVVTNRLTKEENLWLKSLTYKIKETTVIENLLDLYKENNKNPLYESVMEMIIRANKGKFEEVRGMCQALRELMKDEIEEELKISREIARQEGREDGEEIGKEIGIKCMNDLIIMLSKAGRFEDIVKSAEDKGYQMQLFEEFGL